MAWQDDLTGAALAIAQSNANPLRVVAGPGTGKSFAMKRRVARLLEVEEVLPQRILAVTFTRTAAALLVKDLHSLGVAGCERIDSRTLHSFCFRILSSDGVLRTYDRTPRPLISFSNKRVLQYEAKPMLEDVRYRRRFGGNRDCSDRIRAFEADWARLQDEAPGWPVADIDKQFHEAVIGWLKFHRAMLIGEVVPIARRFLLDNPASPWRRAYDHVIVDEYQDLNKAEQSLIDLLAESANAAVVGDVDQSIYRFRHANPEGIEQYPANHPNTQDEPLVECRRCPRRVVRVADHLIRHNHPAPNSPRLTERPENNEGQIEVVQWTSAEEEAQGLAAYVIHLVNDLGYAPEEILVLTPRRRLGYQIRDAIAAGNIKVHSFYHEEALEEQEAQEAMALMTLLADRDDRVALRWWLGHDCTTWRVGPYAALRAHCEGSGLSPWQALESLTGDPSLCRGAANLIQPFSALRERLAAIADLSLQHLVDALLPEGNEGCCVLREAAVAACDSCDSTAKLVAALHPVVSQPDTPAQEDFVRVMSLHKSKGLTSRVVIISGCIEGLVPFIDDNATDDEKAEIEREQRRLFYVAITRTTDLLVLSSFATIDPGLAFQIGARLSRRSQGGQVGHTIASHFLSELGPQAPPSEFGPDWRSQWEGEPADD